MSKQSMGDWLRSNSERVPVEVVLTDGERLKGTLLVPKERSIRDILNGQEPFMEFDCVDSGATVLSKASIRSLRQFALPKAGQLAEHVKYLDSVGAFRALGLSETATAGQLHDAYRRLAPLYNPDDYRRGSVPDEIVDYVASMARRHYLAFTEIKAAIEKREEAELAAAAATDDAPATREEPAPKALQPSIRPAADEVRQQPTNAPASSGRAAGQIQTLRKLAIGPASPARSATS